MKLKLVAASVIAASLSSASTHVFADDTLVITANRISQDINEVLADVEVIDRAEIERIQPRSFVDLMEGIAGVDIIKRGGHGQNSSLFVRGTNSNQTLILIDGVRVGSATLGEKALSTIAISQIERIEIVKGPRAAVWGSDAIGGVIQIFTRRYATGEHQASITAGSNSSQARDIALGFGTEAFNQTITYAMKETNGIDARVGFGDDKDGSSVESYALRGDYLLAENHELDWIIQKDRSNAAFDTSFGGDRTRTDVSLFNIRYSTDFSGWDTSFSLNSSKDESATFDQSIGYDPGAAFVTEKKQFSAVSYKSLNEGLNFVGGIDWIKDDISESITEYAEEERTTKSFMVGLNYRNEIVLADVTVRRDDVENVDSRTSSNVSVGYKPSQKHLISLNYAEGFKAPSFNDLFHPWGGNPTLKFETSENLEMLYKYNAGNVGITTTLYKSDIENLIQWIPTNGVWAPENVGKAKLQGGTFDLNVTDGDYRHGLNVSVVEPEDKQTGLQLIRRSRIQASYDFSYQGEAFDWSVQVNHAGSRMDTSSKLKAYTRLNLSAGYDFNQNWSLKLKINDAMDKAPTQVEGYYALGREYFLTVTHRNLF